jgi:hypothetical protein
VHLHPALLQVLRHDRPALLVKAAHGGGGGGGPHRVVRRAPGGRPPAQLCTAGGGTGLRGRCKWRACQVRGCARRRHGCTPWQVHARAHAGVHTGQADRLTGSTGRCALPGGLTLAAAAPLAPPGAPGSLGR